MTGTQRPPVGLADVLRALDALAADEATTQQILALLGVSVREPSTVVTSPVVTTASVPAAQARVEGIEPAEHWADGGRRQPTPTRLLQGAPAPVITPEGRVASTAAPRLIPPLRLPTPPPRSTEPASLLPPAQQRAIVGRLSGRREEVGDIDLDRLVALLAERAELRILPRRPTLSTRRGLQLLLDFGPGMQGFQRDRREITAVVAGSVGPDGLEVLRFAGTPLDPPGVGPGNRATWAQYRPPVPGRPVLVVSDLGARSSRRPHPRVVEQWAATAHLLRKSGSPITALVPCPVQHVDPVLRKTMSVVCWDRSTGVREAVGAAASVRYRSGSADR